MRHRDPAAAADAGGRLTSPEALMRAAIEQLALAGQSVKADLCGPALYVLGPPSYSVAACRACGAVVILVGLPARPIIFWTHELCGRTYRLEPPLAALSAGLALEPRR